MTNTNTRMTTYTTTEKQKEKLNRTKEKTTSHLFLPVLLAGPARGSLLQLQGSRLSPTPLQKRLRKRKRKENLLKWRKPRIAGRLGSRRRLPMPRSLPTAKRSRHLPKQGGGRIQLQGYLRQQLGRLQRGVARGGSNEDWKGCRWISDCRGLHCCKV